MTFHPFGVQKNRFNCFSILIPSLGLKKVALESIFELDVLTMGLKWLNNQKLVLF
jgi:hypothetical protein